jgi:hypothetical protein
LYNDVILELYLYRFDLIVVVPGIDSFPPVPAGDADSDVSAVNEAELLFAFSAGFENRILAVSADERQILVEDFRFPALSAFRYRGRTRR